MIQTSAAMRILVAIQPVDFRKGIDGLAAVCRQQLAEDPLSGWAFVFRNRLATAVKILLYDGQGFWLCHKKLETEDTQIFGFTEIRRAAYNRRLGLAEIGRMVGISRKSGPRRSIMLGQGSLSAPPRAQRQRESFCSTNSGR